MRKLVYIASPLSGDMETNLGFARQACLNAMAQGVTPLRPTCCILKCWMTTIPPSGNWG